MNPDEAVGFGLGWAGALRSKKHRIPYEVAIKDRVSGLSSPLKLSIIDTAGV